VQISAVEGTIASVSLRSSGHRVPGRLTPAARKWTSTGRLTPSTAYTASVRLLDGSGQPARKTFRFTTTKADKLLTMSATPGPGWTMGVGEPVVVTFNAPVAHPAAVERHMSVTTSRGHLAGAWHWFSSSVVHFRPRHFWPADTTVHVHVDLRHIYAGEGRWGDRNHDWSWRVGASHVTYVSATRHTFRVTSDGTTIHRWPTGMGMPGFATRSGVYIVLDKSHNVQMKSCSVGLSCKPGTPTYYNLTVHWDTRITDSGTFVHAAPWDSQIGYANTSHGCIHLTTADAERFYSMSVPGDVVIVRGTSRPANLADRGMADWNMTWSQWRAGSALH
jgi:lipoprotein-anchoring transpeptidase ErfK/SrfK